jgi:hypothetical protein
MCTGVTFKSCDECDHDECPGKKGVFDDPSSEGTPFVCPRQHKQHKTVLATVAFIPHNSG